MTTASAFGLTGMILTSERTFNEVTGLAAMVMVPYGDDVSGDPITLSTSGLSTMVLVAASEGATASTCGLGAMILLPLEEPTPSIDPQAYLQTRVY